MSGPSVSELLDWFDRCEGLPTIRAAIGAVLRRESSPEQEARHAALTEAIAAGDGRMTTPREDAIAALREALAHIDKYEDAMGHSYCDLNVGGGWASDDCTCGYSAKRARWGAALAAAPETPDLACDRNDWCARQYGHRGDCKTLGAEAEMTPKWRAVARESGHTWVDLASPETAEALTRALRGMKPCGDPDCPDRHFGWCDREVASLLAAMRETGR